MSNERAAERWRVGTARTLFGPLSLELNHKLPETVTFQADCQHPVNICHVKLRWHKTPWNFSALINLLLPLSLLTHFSQNLAQTFLMPHASKFRLTSLSLSRWLQPSMLDKIMFICHLFPNIFPLHLKESLLSFHDPCFLSQRRKCSQSPPR